MLLDYLAPLTCGKFFLIDRADAVIVRYVLLNLIRVELEMLFESVGAHLSVHCNLQALLYQMQQFGCLILVMAMAYV